MISTKTVIIYFGIVLATNGFVSDGRQAFSNLQDATSAQSAASDQVSSIFEAYDGTMNDEDIKERLDTLADYLKISPGFRAHIVSYGGLRSCHREAVVRARAAKDYLWKRKGINPKRIVIIDGGFQEAWTVQLWTTAEGASPPTAISTVDRRKVKIYGKCKFRPLLTRKSVRKSQ